jgi:hypothetical protein
MENTMNERELDLLVADLQHENKQIRNQRDAAIEEALRLRHTLEHIYAKCILAVQEGGPSRIGGAPPSHTDKSSY